MKIKSQNIFLFLYRKLGKGGSSSRCEQVQTSGTINKDEKITGSFDTNYVYNVHQTKLASRVSLT